MKITFVDETNEYLELTFCINKDNRLYIESGNVSEEYMSGYVTLHKEDVRLLIIELKRMQKLME